MRMWFRYRKKLLVNRRKISPPVCFLLLLSIFCVFVPVPRFLSPYSLTVYDRNDELLGASIAADEQWRFPPGESLPVKFIQCIVNYEDRRFFSHPGFDPLALVRAIALNVNAGEVVSGGSTLTMQVVRLSRAPGRRTLWRKALETILAVRLELALTKDQILSMYAANAPFGGNVVGLEAAAWRYFGRDPKYLSWAETAMLAVLPNSPSLIHPGRNRALLKRKRDRLLCTLCSRGIIDSMTCDLARSESLPEKPFPLPGFAPHLLQRIKLDFSDREFPRVKTTLDKTLQIRTTSVVMRHYRSLAENDIHNIAALILDVDSGRVLAYVGNVLASPGQGFGNQVDIITSARSTGSILKPFLYAGMLSAGEVLPTQLVPDIPTRLGGFAPQNYSKSFEGAVSAERALARSLNIPAVYMLSSYGVDRFYDLLKDLGITTLFRPARDYGLALILGGAEGTLWDITSMYAGLAKSVSSVDGVNRSGSFLIEKSGREDQPAPASVSSLLPAAASWLTVQAMLEVDRPGDEYVWRDFTSSRRIAWKTGTSYGFRDAWAIGITPEYAVGVWVGNASGEGRPGLTGISAAAPILFQLFGLLPAGRWFECPEVEMTEIAVCAHSGYRVGPSCDGEKRIRVPLAGRHSIPCPFCQLVHCDSTLSWRVHSECEQMTRIETLKWFVLPPAMEWYYRSKHSDYRVLPPFRSDCIPELQDDRPSMTLISPQTGDGIYVPLELDGHRGRVVFEATHRQADMTIYWHLDRQYVAATREIHQLAVVPPAGNHLLTLVDENGERLQRRFTILDKE